jgi:polygalacturonase
MMRLALLAFCFVACASSAGAQRPPTPINHCDIAAFGATPDDNTLDDSAIEAAIAACAPRGGTVVVPAGVFVTGGVELRSNITLHLAGGAVLRGSTRLQDYRRFDPDIAARIVDNPDDQRLGDRGLLSGVGVENVTIDGTGTIDGSGAAFWGDTANRPTFSLDLSGCRNVRMRDVTFMDPATYHIRMSNCDDVVIDGVTIRAPMLAPNSDGLQIRDSADVRIANCLIETGDDAIVLKSRERFVERVTITNCRITSDDAAIKFGTGSRLGVRDVSVSNVIVTNSRYGVALFMQDGGVYENVRFADMNIETGGRHARAYPIMLDVDTRGSAGELGTIRNVTFDGLDIRTAGNILIGGQANAPIRDLTLSNIRMRVSEGTDLAATAGKPRGNRSLPRSALADFSGEVAHIVLGHVEGVRLVAVDVTSAGGDSVRPRLIVRGGANIEGAAALRGRR